MLLRDIAPLAKAVPANIAALLDGLEVTALPGRVALLLRQGVLPVDHTGMHYPWSLV